jgi:hypothetical protein
VRPNIFQKFVTNKITLKYFQKHKMGFKFLFRKLNHKFGIILAIFSKKKLKLFQNDVIFIKFDHTENDLKKKTEK